MKTSLSLLVVVALALAVLGDRVGSAQEFRSAFSTAVKAREPWMIVVDSNSIGPMKKIFAGPDGSAAAFLKNATSSSVSRAMS